MLRKFKKSDLYRSMRQYMWHSINRNVMRNLLLKERKKPKKQLQFPKKIGIIFQGTQNYIRFFPNYYKNITKFFLPNTKKEFFVLTDQIDYEFLKSENNINIVQMPHSKYVMLNAYNYMDKASKKMKKCDYIVWIDADMYLEFPLFERDFFIHGKPLFSVRHPNFIKRQGTFETNPKSLAYVAPDEDKSIYVQACFWGGKTKEVLKLVKELKKRIETDLKNKIIAKLEDESHLNKYRIEHPSLFHIYDPTYAYPKNRPLPKGFRKKIIHEKFKKFKITG